jgi:hypothetical protein
LPPTWRAPSSATPVSPDDRQERLGRQKLDRVGRWVRSLIDLASSDLLDDTLIAAAVLAATGSAGCGWSACAPVRDTTRSVR